MKVKAGRSSQTCRRVTPLLPALSDGALRAEQSALVQAHLERCPECRDAARLLAEVGGLLAEEPFPGAALPSGAEAARRIIERSGDGTRPKLPGRTGPWIYAWGLGAAAALAIALLGRTPPSQPVDPAAFAPPPPADAQQAPLPALVVNDDEREGRQVLLISPAGRPERHGQGGGDG